jgi:hypothetical protein
MKDYLIDLATGTIVAAVLTLLAYILGFDKTWSDAAETYGICFFVYVALSIFSRIKKK